MIAVPILQGTPLRTTACRAIDGLFFYQLTGNSTTTVQSTPQECKPKIGRLSPPQGPPTKRQKRHRRSKEEEPPSRPPRGSLSLSGTLECGTTHRATQEGTKRRKNPPPVPPRGKPCTCPNRTPRSTHSHNRRGTLWHLD